MPLGHKVGEEDKQRGFRELGRLQSSDSFQAEPAVSFAIGDENQNLKHQHYANRSECPGRAMQASIIALLEIHENYERENRPDQLVAYEMEAGFDARVELGHYGRCAVDHHQAETDHGDDGGK